MRPSANVEQFSVFISSANELAEERAIACEVIEELNRASHALDHGYRFASLIYERDAVSDVGRPQDVIDRNMARVEDVDLFVCILWRRLGEGTTEELDRALASYAKQGRPRLIFMRSKRGFPLEQPSIELQTLLTKLEGESLLSIYNDAAEFRRGLRENLDGVTRAHLVPLLQAEWGDNHDSRILDLVSEVWLSNGSEMISGRGDFPLYASDLASPDAGPMALSPETLHHTYARKLKQLVILGEPGAGKSHALLKLLECLIIEARSAMRRSQDYSLPIVVNAASWMENRATIQAWLADEMRVFYNLPPKSIALLKSMLDDGKLTVLIDGLDEIEPERTGATATPRRDRWVQQFVLALNDLLRDGSMNVVVVCRTELYFALEQKLNIDGEPICIEPLSQQTIDKFVDHPELTALRAAMREIPALANLAKSPFLLSVMGIAYANVSLEVFKTLRTGAAPEEQLFKQYIQRQFGHSRPPPARGSARAAPTFGRTDSQRWLGWLATKLKTSEAQRNMRGSMLLIERMAPSWMEGSGAHFSSYALSAAALLAIFLVIVTSLPCALAIGFEFAAWRASIWAGVLRGLYAGLITGVVGGLLLVPGFCLARGWGIAVSIGLAFGSARGILIGMSLSDDGTTTMGFDRGLSDGLMTLSFSLPGAAYIMRTRNYRRDEIEPIEVVDERWIRQWRRGWIGLPVGLACCCLIGVLRDWGRGAGLGLVFGLLVGCVAVFTGTPLPAHVRPNQGIMQSMRHALRMGSAMAVIAVVSFGVSYGAAQDLSHVRGRIAAIVNGTLGLVLFAVSLFFGALPVIQHYGLRIALWRRGVLPLRLVDFLEFAVRLRLLRRVGGAYIFVHDSLRQYFERFARERDS